MIEIARNYKVNYEPDPSMFLVSISPSPHAVLLLSRSFAPLQEDDVPPSIDAKPFLPDDEPRGGGGGAGGGGGGGAGPLPQKEEPRYVHTPQSQPPPPSNQVCMCSVSPVHSAA